MCAGIKDADDYFTQICSLSAPPLKVLTASRDAGDDLDSMASALESAGYPVYYIDESDSQQIYLSACQKSSGAWVITNTSNFASECG